MKFSYESSFLLGLLPIVATAAVRTATIPESGWYDGLLAKRNLYEEPEFCANLIKSGDAETGDLSDWQVKDYISGTLEFTDFGAAGGTKSYKHTGRNHKNSGPGQDLPFVCFEKGKQYQLKARMKLEEPCDKNAEWLDDNFCPLFSILALLPTGPARLNLGNFMPAQGNWSVTEWTDYVSIFTVDDHLASSTGGFLYIRGVAPGRNIIYDDVSIIEFIGEDTPNNFWTGAPPPEGTTSLPDVSTTVADSVNASSDVLYDSNIVYKYYTDDTYDESTGVCTQLIPNGNAEAGSLEYWTHVGMAGAPFIHNVGPRGSTKSFRVIDRYSSSAGIGQDYFNVSCMELGQNYEFKAKIKLVDENGFPYPCDKSATRVGHVLACPVVTWVFTTNLGEDHFFQIPNDIQDDWLSEEFNEYHAVFKASEGFLGEDFVKYKWFVSGPTQGVSIIIDDVSLMKTDLALASEQNIPLLQPEWDGSCNFWVKSGTADGGNLADWQIMDESTGLLEVDPYGPEGSSSSFKHSARGHINSGPGQPIDLSCLIPGKQYLVTGQFKIIDDSTGPYACDKFAEWSDPDFCPLFSIWTKQAYGIARFNIGNDYPSHTVWEEGEWNRYHAIFTIDEKMSEAQEAFFYIRGPRPGVTLYYDQVHVQDYLGDDTRFNFWTGALEPVPVNETNSTEEVIKEEEELTTTELVCEDNGYVYYESQDSYPVASNVCEELVVNGDAEPGDLTGWQLTGNPGYKGELQIYPSGPNGQTRSFRHVDRINRLDGPGQDFDMSCLEENTLYEVRAKFKLLDENGFPYRCLKLGNDPLSCPIFNLWTIFPDGTPFYKGYINDNKFPCQADEFTEFHALFFLTPDMAHSAKLKWHFRGPRAGVTMIIDDVSIQKYKHQIEPTNITFAYPEGCEFMTVNPDASSGAVRPWSNMDGHGYISAIPEDPVLGKPAFKHFARTSHSNGPSQISAIKCHDNGRKYNVTARFYLENGFEEPYACDPKAAWNTPEYCPMVSLYVNQPWGKHKHNYRNMLKEPMTAGWNDFYTEFYINTMTEFPSEAKIYLRGPTKDTVFYFNDVHVLQMEEPPVYVKPEIPPLDNNWNCDAYCCEIAKNGDVEDEFLRGWSIQGFKTGQLVKAPFGADGSKSSVHHKNREDINSGPGQVAESGCIVGGEWYEIKAKVMISGPNGEELGCNDRDSVMWNSTVFCPLFSFAYKQKGGKWFDVRNDAPTSASWEPGKWNDYTSVFQLPDEMSLAYGDIYWMFRGPQPGVDILVDQFSLKPYNHVPDYVGTDEGTEEAEFVDFFKQADIYEVPGEIAPLCKDMIVNPDFEWGNTTGWNVNMGGILGIRACNINDGQYCLQVSQRTSRHMGPRQLLDTSCFEVGKKFELHAKIALLDSTWQPFMCDKDAGLYSQCPLLTFNYITASGDEKWRYAGNRAEGDWVADSFNEYYALFDITEDMVNSTRFYFYFERPPAGVNMVFDNIQMGEVLTQVDTTYTDALQTCNKLVLNGDFEVGDYRGWTPRLGGHLFIHPEGADMSRFSLMHTGRKSFVMGPKHELPVNCLFVGMNYVFEARMRMEDADGKPWACDKNHRWGDSNACPLLTFQLEYADKTKKWFYFSDETKGTWSSAEWNFWHSKFLATEEYASAVKAHFYIERVKEDVTLYLDEVRLNRDCSTIIPNWNAENDLLTPWEQKGGPGSIAITDGGASGSLKTFVSEGRTSYAEGPSHPIEILCLTRNVEYVIKGKFKLLENGTPFMCNKQAPWGDPLSCPVVSLVLLLPNGVGQKVVDLDNSVPTDWIPEEFNDYAGIFTADEEMLNATIAHVMIKGPKPGVSILFDEISVSMYSEGEINCENLIVNSDFEDPDITMWIPSDGTQFVSHEGGAEGSMTALKIFDRSNIEDGIIYKLDDKCLVEGVNYEVSAYIKLLDEAGNAVDCDKTAPYDSGLGCPLLEIEIHSPNDFKRTFPQNLITDNWYANDWNEYVSDFVVSSELANAEIANFKISGVAPGISIVVDKFQTKFFEPISYNCKQLIFKTNAEDGDVTGWKSNGGGYVSTVEGGDAGSFKAFAYLGRQNFYDGPKQTIPMECMNVGDTFEVSARFKFLDVFSNPFACDKNAPWKDDNFCLVMTVECNTNGNIKRELIWNNYGGEWIADDFNSFRGVLTVTDAMANSDGCFLFFQGPRGGINFNFDNVSVRLIEDAIRL